MKTRKESPSKGKESTRAETEFGRPQDAVRDSASVNFGSTLELESLNEKENSALKAASRRCRE